MRPWAVIEYAVEHLGVKYIMVLGHERCGAVEAAVKGGKAPGHIGSLIKAIQPAVDQARSQPGELLDNAVRANVTMVVRQVKSSAPILKERVEKGDLTVVGARYDLDDGVVAILRALTDGLCCSGGAAARCADDPLPCTSHPPSERSPDETLDRGRFPCSWPWR